MKLSQKYRPGRFAEVIGQAAAVEVLRTSIMHNRYSSAYMFSGLPGIGKTTAGRIFAKAVLCDNTQAGEPCGECESCRLFEKDQHFGYTELDSASVGGKDEMVKLRNEANSLGVSKKKIILLDECHDISKAGQDALLDQVEKCPEHLIYIFCTTDPDKMKKSLRDRCMQFQFSKVNPDMIAGRLRLICEKEKFAYDEEALSIIAARADGHVRVAINMVEETLYLGSITKKNIDLISRDYDEEIFTILANLGVDLSKVIEIYQQIAATISVSDFYNNLLSMVGDAAKSLYGYDSFSPKRKELIARLKDIHGYSLLEFLNYFISRDKYVDKIGVQSDLIVLHYKFTSQNFIPKTPSVSLVNIQNNTQKQNPPIQSSKENAPLPLFPQLQKLSIIEKAKLLRETGRNQNTGLTEKSEKVPTEWSLPKEERLGESFEEEELSPLKFSQLLVGGRGGEL